MAKAIMIQGTMSGAGKSLIAGALCRIFARAGYRTVPFKSQNMALNSYVTSDGLEMGRAQVMQAEAAWREPDVRMNPILLKPTSDVGSQVIINGRPIGNMPAGEYFRRKREFIPEIRAAYESLAAENDIIVIEGAGSPAEINLKSDDIVNMGMARIADAPVLLVGDIDRGGVFAQLYGTVALLEPDERDMIKGLIINKFRGDKALLGSGLDTISRLTKKPVAGVVPYTDADIDDEDSLTQRFDKRAAGEGIDIAVIRLPRISNFTDLTPFECVAGVSLRYVSRPRELGEPDMVILPGTKSTVSDLKWLRTSGLEAGLLRLAGKGMPVFGICGGFQMLGRSISDPDNVEGGAEIRGMGLLDTETVFRDTKITRRTRGTINGIGGIFAGLSGKKVSGYEIHMGITRGDSPLVRCRGNVYGSYLHGIFDSAEVTDVIISALAKRKGIDLTHAETFDMRAYKEKQYDILADAVYAALDMKLIYKIVEEGI